MSEDLLVPYAGAISAVGQGVASEGFYLFKPEALPPCPPMLSTSRLAVLKRTHAYEAYFFADSLVFCGERDVYQALACVILATLLHASPDTVELTLKSGATEIRRLIIKSPCVQRRGAGLLVHAARVEYIPEQPHRHPFLTAQPQVSPSDLPTFLLGPAEECPLPAPPVQVRDTVIGFGTDLAHALLGTFLLNISSAAVNPYGYSLEGEAGFRGVGIRSAEAIFLLPGTHGWLDPC